jgi:hypothetical protein
MKVPHTCWQCGKQTDADVTEEDRVIQKSYGASEGYDTYFTTCPNCSAGNIIKVPIRAD